MANTVKTSRDQIVNAALEIIEKSGAKEVSVRTIAQRLCISTQPIYREFGDMASVMRAVKERGYELFWEYLKGAAEDQAARYVMFAVERGRLFDFLMRGDGGQSVDFSKLKYALMPSTDIIERLMAITGLDKEMTYDLHFKLWLSLHGLAVMAANGMTSPTADEVKAFIRGFTMELAAGKRKKTE